MAVKVSDYELSFPIHWRRLSNKQKCSVHLRNLLLLGATGGGALPELVHMIDGSYRGLEEWRGKGGVYFRAEALTPEILVPISAMSL